MSIINRNKLNRVNMVLRLIKQNMYLNNKISVVFRLYYVPIVTNLVYKLYNILQII